MPQQKYVAWPTGQKEEVLARIKAHREANEIVQDVDWDGARGGVIGCTVNKYDYSEYAQTLGVCWEVAHLINAIHSSLPPELALDWPARVVLALRPGADTTDVWPRFVAWAIKQPAWESLEADPTWAEKDADKLEEILKACPDAETW